MKKLKKIISMMLCVASLTSFGITSLADAEDSKVTEEQATKIAINFVISRAHTEQTEESFPVPFKLVKDETIYGLDDNISAYKFDVLNEDGEYSGYVIAGAQMNVAPIIEYSCSKDESFIDKSIEVASINNEDTKLYYDGGLNYYIEDVKSKNLYDTQTAAKVSQSALKSAMLTNSKTPEKDNEQLEKDWENALGQASNPPTNTYISDPLNYESGYTGYTMKYISGATANMYRLMSSFSGYSNHCGPTAATNLCILNYKLNSKTKLMYTSWDNTFKRLYSLSGCNSTGTSDSNLRAALVTYGKERGYSSTTATRVTSPSESSMRASITNNVPQILLVNGHGYYGDHYVLTVGVEKYNYSSGSSTYFRVIDGWSTSQRYIYYKSSYMTSTITTTFE